MLRGESIYIYYPPTNANDASYSPKNYTRSNGNSVLGTPNSGPARRQSPRLKAFSDIYESVIANVSTRIEVETIILPDDPSIDETLTDMKAKCNAKKQKVRTSVELEVEEPDLNEPLISLKWSNKSFKDKKRRKCAGLSELNTLEKEVATILDESADANLGATSVKDSSAACMLQLVYNAKSETVETCDAVSSTSVFTDNCNVLSEPYSSTQIGTETADSISQSVNEVSGDAAKIDCHQNEGKVYVSSSSNLDLIPILNVESEIVETCDAVSSTSVFTDNCNVLSETYSCTKKGTDTANSISQSVNEVSGDAAKIDCHRSEGKVYVSSSNLDLIPILNAGSLPSRLHVNIEEVKLVEKNLTSFTSEVQNSCVNEGSRKFMEIDSYSLPENNNEQFGENKEMVSSEVSGHKLSTPISGFKVPMLYSDNCDSLQLVPATTDLTPDDVYLVSVEGIMHGSVRNQLNCLATGDNERSVHVNNGTASRMSEEFESQGDEMHACTHKSSTTINHTAHARDVYDLCHASGFNDGFSEDAGSLTSLVLSTLSATSRGRKIEDDNNPPIEKSFSVAPYDQRDAYELPVVNESSTESENLNSSSIEQPLNAYEEKSVCCGEVDRKELTEAVACCSPQVSPPCLSAADDSLSEASEIILSISEEKLDINLDRPTCSSSEISDLVEREELNMEKEIEQGQGLKADHPPKKLLSNRKDFPPTSQEILQQALIGEELNDTNKTADYVEAERIPSVETMPKRSSSSGNSPLQPISTGISKFPDKSEKVSCSCLKDHLIQVQGQKAAAFCQRQMQDTEKMANKLLKVVESLKNHVEASMGPEAAEEVKKLVNDALSAEEYSTKLLSMMARDCTRFCKIMNPTDNKTLSPIPARKQRRKITFADEAGGSLCHIKHIA